MKYTVFLFVSLFFLTNCGGGSGSGNRPSSVTLYEGQIETVYPGDKLVKNEPDTIVRIRHTAGEDTSTVELLSGSATITHQ
jgi:hypothetical protein